MAPTPTGTREQRSGEDVLVLTRRIRASVAEVWATITESDRSALWIGTWTGEPASGTVQFTMGFEGDAAEPEVFTIDSCRTPVHLAVTSAMPYDAEADEENPTVWHVAFDLSDATDGGDVDETIMRFSQTVPDPSWAENIGPGWEYYMDRLAAAAVGADALAIDFDDYYPAQSVFYQELFAADR